MRIIEINLPRIYCPLLKQDTASSLRLPLKNINYPIKTAKIQRPLLKAKAKVQVRDKEYLYVSDGIGVIEEKSQSDHNFVKACKATRLDIFAVTYQDILLKGCLVKVGLKSAPRLLLFTLVSIYYYLKILKRLPIMPKRHYFKLYVAFVQRNWLIYLLEKIIDRRLVCDNNLKEVFMTTFYTCKGLALLKFSHNYGVQSVEIQHGVIYPSHLAYKIFIENCELVPRKFILDSHQDENLVQHYLPSSNTTVYKDPVMIQTQTKTKIVVSLQPLIDPQYFESLIEIISKNDDFHFELRLHPAQALLPQKLKILLSYLWVSVINPTDPIEISLKSALGHITHSSSVARQAMLNNVPTLFVNKEMMAYFSDSQQNEMYYDSATEFFHALRVNFKK
jgi:hypothetical protein